MTYYAIIFSFFIVTVYANTPLHEEALFSGRISKVSRDSSLVRLRVDFENMKFINQKDKIEFWHEDTPGRRCTSYVEGRSNRYLLLKVSNFKECITKVGFSTGTYLHLYSEDLLKTLYTARDLNDVLIKKRLALSAKEKRYKKEVLAYDERLEILNKRYEVLRKKLELEWQNEINALEEDKSKAMKEYKNAQARLNDVENKMLQYRIEDNNLKEDRWSLDPNLYFKK